MTNIPDTPARTVEGWARREIRRAGTPAERGLMAVVTHRVASLFAPAQASGRVTAQDWIRIASRPDRMDRNIK